MKNNLGNKLTHLLRNTTWQLLQQENKPTELKEWAILPLLLFYLHFFNVREIYFMQPISCKNLKEMQAYHKQSEK